MEGIQVSLQDICIDVDERRRMVLEKGKKLQELIEIREKEKKLEEEEMKHRKEEIEAKKKLEEIEMLEAQEKEINKRYEQISKVCKRNLRVSYTLYNRNIIFYSLTASTKMDTEKTKL